MARVVQLTQLLPLLAVAVFAILSGTTAFVITNENGPSESCICEPVLKPFNETISDKVKSQCRKCYVFKYKFSKSQNWAANLCIRSPNVTEHNPLLIAVRESLSVMSFQVPQKFSSVSSFSEVCHTLCPLRNYFDPELKPGDQKIFVEMSTSSDTWVDFEVVMAIVYDFVMIKEMALTVNITPSQPRVMQYNMEKDLRAVRIEATSDDDSCMILAIQGIQCPFYDSEITVNHAGFYQTLMRQSGISITRRTFDEGQVSVVLILKPTDADCVEHDVAPQVTRKRWKEVTVRIVPSITDQQYYEAVFGAFGFYVLIYIFSFVICCFLFVRKRRSTAESQTVNIESPSIQNYGTSSETRDSSESSSDPDTSQSLNNVAARRNSDSESLDETDMDKLPDAKIDKNVVRTKTILYVADLARKNDRYLSERTKVYSW